MTCLVLTSCLLSLLMLLKESLFLETHENNRKSQREIYMNTADKEIEFGT